MNLLLHPVYFPNIATCAAIVRHGVTWEVMDNYQKQTYRNRCYICTDQGRHLLTIPIKHVGGDQGRQQYRFVCLDNSYPWQRQHWRTLQTAYRTSPFFEYFEDDFAPLFLKPFRHLLEFNLKTIEIICRSLQVAMPESRTTVFENSPTGLRDARYLVNAKEPVPQTFPEYVQVFGDRHGFIGNTSVLDLLFNEGPQALNYLHTIDLKISHG